MVAMENAFLGNPVVCFDKGNGAIEFINNENGYVTWPRRVGKIFVS